MTGRRFWPDPGRSPEDIARDHVAIVHELDDIDAAQQLWHRLDRLSRSAEATTFTRQRAKVAANALGVLLDTVAAAEQDTGERPFTWNDRPNEDAER